MPAERREKSMEIVFVVENASFAEELHFTYNFIRTLLVVSGQPVKFLKIRRYLGYRQVWHDERYARNRKGPRLDP